MDYFWLTIKHKWFVFLAGLKYGAPLIRLITHDLSKFGFKEYIHYQKQFFGSGSDKFNEAWIHHQNTNDHHWEYWIPRTGHDKGDSLDNVPLPMSCGAVREMLADWVGASRAYTGQWPSEDNWPWLDRVFETKIAPRLHPDTLNYVVKRLYQMQLTTKDFRKKYF